MKQFTAITVTILILTLSACKVERSGTAKVTDESTFTGETSDATTSGRTDRTGNTDTKDLPEERPAPPTDVVVEDDVAGAGAPEPAEMGHDVGGERLSKTYYFTTGMDLASPSMAPAMGFGSFDGAMVDAKVDLPAGEAGVLTAGEINDFAKWKLWGDIAESTLAAHRNTWGIHPKHRFPVQAMTHEGQPLVGARVDLKDALGRVLWTAMTDNTGKAELWAGMFSDDSTAATLVVQHDGETKEIRAQAFHNGIPVVKFDRACAVSDVVDISFVVDATGSMGDEIRYLQEEMADIISSFRKGHDDLELRLSSVFYRDAGDAYLTREIDFTTTTPDVVRFIREQQAGGGGDFPEAVNEALKKSIRDFKWSADARAKILFLILDAPPHGNPEVVAEMKSLIMEAAQKGIRIIPIAGSGIDKSTEYLCRTMALGSNGTYVFLTDHSGVGNAHIEPTTDDYEVETLNAALLRLMDSYTFFPDCPDVQDVPDPVADTVFTNILVTDSADSTIAAVVQRVKLFDFFPNPTTGPVQVNLTITEPVELFVADLSGKLLERIKVQETGSIHLDIRQYPAGTYLLRIADGENWREGKVILYH